MPEPSRHSGTKTACRKQLFPIAGKRATGARKASPSGGFLMRQLIIARRWKLHGESHKKN